MREGSIDNFSVFYDENPGCPEDARFKALSEWMDENKGRHLCCYVNADGFYSFYAPYAGGIVTLLPTPVCGDTLEVNFATSVVGGMQITLLDEDGTPIEGYESYVMFGDSVSRPVEFEKPLSALRGKHVSLRISLKDAHLYSFAFV